MLRRRAGRPGLIGAAARTAVIAGTATATSNAVNRRQAARAQQQAEAQAYEQQQYAPPPAAPPPAAPPPVEPAPAPAAPAENDLIGQLTRLGELHSQGILDDAEFAAAKQRLLG
ncbi:SHOCT domain-containing protein [Nocardioides sp. NPDC047086]|uniref:SHOCT domain-containing protein n=1 Tax=Nocardioides sp. NPDC047086 TaxID=3154810 RepID=UPI0033C1F70A